METRFLSKAERTSRFILKKVAPLFNKNGYAGTSMTDITGVTGLTKGAIYGNFENKERLALAAFNYNFKWIISRLNEVVLSKPSAIDKLLAITEFYRGYYDYVIDFGGCPIVNISVDTHHQNPLLFARAKQVIERMLNKMVDIIELGKKQGIIRKNLDAKKNAGLIFSQIEGAIFMAVISKDPGYIANMLDHIDDMILKTFRT